MLSSNLKNKRREYIGKEDFIQNVIQIEIKNLTLVRPKISIQKFTHFMK